MAVAPFQVDATPPLGSPLCAGSSGRAKKVVDRLSTRGLVLLTDQRPIVLCVVDWSGIGNTGHDAWRRALADAAGTTMERVTVHVVHCHDAPNCDFHASRLLTEQALGGAMCNVPFAWATIARAGRAVRQAIKEPQVVTHLGMGKAKVERIASNRRVLGPDGNVKHIRFSACTNPAAVAAPEGVIDPYVRLISFLEGDRAIASITYYATHPQSFYGRGAVSTDFVGLARALREATQPSVAHIHFNGAGGNVGCGKYNDGEPARRYELAGRLAEGMRKAFQSIKKIPVSGKDIEWRVKSVAFPMAEHLVAKDLRRKLEDASADAHSRVLAALDLSWIDRCRSGHRIDLTCLRIGPAYILHMPGELFVEYQLAAQKMRPDGFVCMAAYGDHGPCYIGTEIAYSQGGYETENRATHVSPKVESVLIPAIRQLLK